MYILYVLRTIYIPSLGDLRGKRNLAQHETSSRDVRSIRGAKGNRPDGRHKMADTTADKTADTTRNRHGADKTTDTTCRRADTTTDRDGPRRRRIGVSKGALVEGSVGRRAHLSRDRWVEGRMCRGIGGSRGAFVEGSVGRGASVFPHGGDVSLRGRRDVRSFEGP